MAGLFSLSAIVQLNDPDPLAWVAVYAACALTCLLAITQYWHRIVSTIVFMVCVLWAITIASGIHADSSVIDWSEVFSSMEMKSAQTEMVREFGGLLIAAAWMLVLTLRFRN